MDLHTGPLGEAAKYSEGYSTERLFPMPRVEGRSTVGLEQAPAWVGADVWTGYEFSWLNTRGKPQVAVLRITVDAASTHIVESKSMKLYLNGYAQTRFDHADEVRGRLTADLSVAFGAQVQVALLALDDSQLEVALPAGQSLDDVDIEISDYQRNPSLLALSSGNVATDSKPVSEALITHLFRSLCPVTAQPDWASLTVAYTGAAIDRAGLLKYLVSYRQHQAFHETTIERIYTDIWQRCQPQRLQVRGYFLRRGGLDISPMRSSEAGAGSADAAATPRLARQ